MTIVKVNDHIIFFARANIDQRNDVIEQRLYESLECLIDMNFLKGILETDIILMENEEKTNRGAKN